MSIKPVALITGANRGIGWEAARQLAQKGWRVFLSARTPDSGIQALDAMPADLHPEFRLLQLDVTSPSSIHAAAEEFGRQFKALDVLVNNAGIMHDDEESVLKLQAETIRDSMETNLIGPLAVTQAFLPFLRQSPQPRIINVSSAAGQLSSMRDRLPAYSLSKAALNALTRQLADALAPEGFAVNAVSPGWCRTDMGGENADQSAAEGADIIIWMAAECPQNRTGEFFRNRQNLDW